VKGILSDVNIQGHVFILVQILTSKDWKGLWEPLNLPLFSFQELNLAPDIGDDSLWEICQKEELVLITGNRNQDGPTSLEAAIRASNTLDSLPVLTIGTSKKVYSDRTYAEKAAAKMVEYLMEIDSYRGTGRLYIP
jgi:hypothetical protein